MKKMLVACVLSAGLMAHAAPPGGIIRSAYLEGTVNEADRSRFDAHMEQVVVSEIGSYPNIRKVKLRKIEARDASAPPVYMIFDLYFDSTSDMDAALASPTRREVQKKIAEVMPLFKGKVYHLITSQD